MSFLEEIKAPAFNMVKLYVAQGLMTFGYIFSLSCVGKKKVSFHQNLQIRFSQQRRASGCGHETRPLFVHHSPRHCILCWILSAPIGTETRNRVRDIFSPVASFLGRLPRTIRSKTTSRRRQWESHLHCHSFLFFSRGAIQSADTSILDGTSDCPISRGTTDLLLMQEASLRNVFLFIKFVNFMDLSVFQHRAILENEALVTLVQYDAPAMGGDDQRT